MSFFARLFSRGERKNCESHSSTGSQVRVHEDGEFVHVSLLAPREPVVHEEEEVDVSRWEMARVLGRRAVSSPDVKTRRDRPRSMPQSKPAVKTRSNDRVAEELYLMEDSLELDMFDDKRNRIIKRSHRRKMNFPEKYKL